jgi:quercetin dioxygenase-like cupin family protein
MVIFRDAATSSRAADSNSFVGTARTKLLASDQIAAPVHVYRVEFESGGRTNWHRHSGPQWLFVLEGHLRVQRWGERASDLVVGDAVVVGPGEKHWHGAVPDARGAHLAVNLAVKTEWLEAVSDDEYIAAPATEERAGFQTVPRSA